MEIISSRHMRLRFLSSKAKNTQTADAAQALKPPGLKGLTEKQSEDPSCPENVEKCTDIQISTNSLAT